MITTRFVDIDSKLALRAVAEARGRPLYDVVRASARRIAVRLAIWTQPYGNDESARKRGQKAVADDMTGLFTTPDKWYSVIEAKNKEAADGFWRSVKDRDHIEMRRFFQQFNIPITSIQLTPTNEVHRNARNQRGKVARSAKDRIMVLDTRARANRIKERQKHVGFSASAWAACAQKFGGTRGLTAERGSSIQRWKRPGSHGIDAPFRADMTISNGDPFATMENLLQWATFVTPRSIIMQAIRAEQETIQRELERATRAHLRKNRLKKTAA